MRDWWQGLVEMVGGEGLVAGLVARAGGEGWRRGWWRGTGGEDWWRWLAKDRSVGRREEQ